MVYMVSRVPNMVLVQQRVDTKLEPRVGKQLIMDGQVEVPKVSSGLLAMNRR